MLALLGRINGLADRVLDRDASPTSRRAALRSLRAALRRVTRRGRPTKLVPEDAAFHWEEIKGLSEQFMALVNEIQTGLPPEEGTARAVVDYIRTW